ncbi:glycoside hydrolase family 9 protein [Deinococcus cellulosilyticus]|nr:glycoside hydrolase family 9 protein [Deinococcus cellulosilyticus]
MNILINHVGHVPVGEKVFLVQSPDPWNHPPQTFQIVDRQHKVVHQGVLQDAGMVTGWQNRHYLRGDFSTLSSPGHYWILVPLETGLLISHEFQISAEIYRDRMRSDILHYFKSQRNSGIQEKRDLNIPIHGTDQTMDASGGWYDASGDVSKYLSHLSYANFLNPQQTPMVVWNFLEAHHRLGDTQSQVFRERLTDEILHGADFLVRMQSPEGCFYQTVFDRWSKDPEERTVCAYSTQQGIKSDQFQAAYRQGGGMAIAALARASTLRQQGAFTPDNYLAKAIKGFEHLEVRNHEYLPDGTENIIDDYCALLAATELYAATHQEVFAGAAHRRAQNLRNRMTGAGWWRADENGERSFWHAAEAGLPVVALLRYITVFPDPDAKHKTLQTVRASLVHQLKLDTAVNNPFCYPRQYILMPGQDRTQFFIPHQNDSGYWWQGENARLASLSVAAQWASEYMPDLEGLQKLAQAPLDWILGFNPFDTCMLQGFGHNNPHYEPGMDNAPGGICNGITSGLHDEDDIDFLQAPDIGPEHSWRWGEQWIPHASWFFLAICMNG